MSEGDNGLGIALVACVALTACNTTDTAPRIETREVRVPVAVSCIPASLPPFIPFSVTREALLNAPDAATRYQLAVTGMMEREARSVEVEPVVAACRTTPESGQ